MKNETGKCVKMTCQWALYFNTADSVEEVFGTNNSSMICLKIKIDGKPACLKLLLCTDAYSLSYHCGP